MRACPKCYSSYVGELEFCGIDGTQLMEVEEDLLIGKTIDRYRVVELLGRGAMGSVYRGQHLSLNRDFALKVLYGDFAANHTLISRFDREATALSKVRHSAIVSVVDFIATESGLNVLIMDYLPGRTLDDLIQDDAPVPPELAAQIAREIASGLAEVHRLGIIHRDVKPSNVLLVPDGNMESAKLVDFGVVAVAEDGDDSDKLTAHGRILGTPRYMAPEQARQMPVTSSVDLYSLGVILFEMLTGQPPFPGTGITDVLVKHVTEAPPDLPPSAGLERLVMALLAKDPADRPANGNEVVQEIDRLLAAWSIGANASLSEGTRPDWAVATRVSSRTGMSGVPSASKFVIIGTVVLFVTTALAVGMWAAQKSESAPPEPLVESITPPDAGIAVPVEPPPPKKVKLKRKTRRRIVKRVKRPKPKGKADPAEQVRLQRRLGKVLARRGLTIADLDDVRSTRKLAKAYKRALRAGDNREATRILPQLISAAEAVKLQRVILQKRLDRLMHAIRASSREVPENLLMDVDKRYLELRVAANGVQGDKSFRRVARGVSQLEAKLRKLRYGH